MTDETFEYLLRTTPPEELRRQMKQLERWFKWQMWADKHPYLAAMLEGARQAGLALIGVKI